jgi:two-component system, OmpR family, response regulator QseB
MIKILLVEDDQDLAEALLNGLQKNHFKMEWVRDGQTAHNKILSDTYQLIILDLGLPKVNGLEVLKQVREAKIKTPIIVLTARDSTKDCVQALNQGADDYMTKPFDLQELIARIHAQDRRSNQEEHTILSYENIELDAQSHTVKLNQEFVYLPRREFALLKKFLENPGKVLSKELLMQSIYNWDDDVDSNVLEVHIHNLRKKMDNHFIRTIRGIGYILKK